MARSNDGIYVSKKVIMQMIVASVVINIIFLLMGMVIGKDDDAWREQGTGDPIPVEDVTTVAEDDPIDLEMSIFERDREAKRDEPIDVAYLDDQAEPQKQAQSADKPVEKARPTEPPKQSATTTGDTAVQHIQAEPSHGDASGTYVVQVVASKNPGKIESMRLTLADKGYRAFVERENGWNRLIVGYFKDESAANSHKPVIDGIFKRMKVDCLVRRK